MNVTPVSFAEFKTVLAGREGIVLLGAGGNVSEWINGIFDILNESAISTAKNVGELFTEKYLLTTTGGRTDLALVMDFEKVHAGKLAMWRLRFGDCSWISDYVVNYADQHGIVCIGDEGDTDDEIDNEQADKPVCELIGTDGNVFSIIGAVSKTLKRADMHDKATEFMRKATNCDSYDEVLNLVHQYVTVR
jgi:hypothetical protein